MYTLCTHGSREGSRQETNGQVGPWSLYMTPCDLDHTSWLNGYCVVRRFLVRIPPEAVMENHQQWAEYLTDFRVEEDEGGDWKWTPPFVWHPLERATLWHCTSGYQTVRSVCTKQVSKWRLVLPKGTFSSNIAYPFLLKQQNHQITILCNGIHKIWYTHYPWKRC